MFAIFNAAARLVTGEPNPAQANGLEGSQQLADKGFVFEVFDI